MPGVLRASLGDDEPNMADLLAVVVGSEPTLRRGCTPRKSHVGNIRSYLVSCPASITTKSPVTIAAPALPARGTTIGIVRRGLRERLQPYVAREIGLPQQRPKPLDCFGVVTPDGEELDKVDEDPGVAARSKCFAEETLSPVCISVNQRQSGGLNRDRFRGTRR